MRYFWTYWFSENLVFFKEMSGSYPDRDMYSSAILEIKSRETQLRKLLSSTKGTFYIHIDSSTYQFTGNALPSLSNDKKNLSRSSWVLNIKGYSLHRWSTVSIPVLAVPLVSSVKSVGRSVMCVSKHLVFTHFAIYVCTLLPVGEEVSYLN